MIRDRRGSFDQTARLKVLHLLPLLLTSVVAGALLVKKSGPSIFGDELGYLSAGRVLAGEGGIFLGGGTSYHPGVGLLYSLAFRVFDSPTHIYSSVLVLNVIQIAVATFLLSRVLVKLGANASDPLLFAPLLWIFGGMLYYSSFAMSEAAVYLIFAGLLYSVVCLCLRESQILIISIGFAHGLVWIVHPRLIVISVVFLISLLTCGMLKHLPAASFSCIAGLLLARFLNAQTTGLIYDNSSDNLVAPLKSLTNFSLEGVIFGSLSKVVYLSISSFGFFLLGIYSVTQLGKEYKFVKFYLLSSITLLILYTSKNFTLESDPKFFFYGRYLEPLTAFVTFLGLVTFLQRSKLRSRTVAALQFSLPILSGIFWLLFRGDSRNYQISNSPGFIFLGEIGSRSGIYFWIFLFSNFLMLIYFFGLRYRATALTILTVVAIFSAISQVKYSLNLSGMQPRHADFVSNVHRIDNKWNTLSVDRTGEGNPWAHIHGTQWWASEYGVQFHDQKLRFPRGISPDVLIHADFNTPSEYELVAADKWTNFSMWALKDRGTVVGLRHPKDMPAESLRGALGGRFFRNGDEVRGEVIIENQSDYQWFPAGGTFGSMGSIRVVLDFHLNGEVILTERVELLGMMWPGQEELLTFEFQNLGDFDRITAEGVHEGVRWFSQVGIPAIELERLEQ